MNPFDALASVEPVRIQENGIDVTYVPGFIDTEESEAYYSALVDEADWHRPKMMFSGLPQETRRQVAWHADEGLTYEYSGQRHRWVDWTPTMLVLRERLQAKLGIDFNGVLLNWYADGGEYVSPHSDDERDMEEGIPIVAVSLGATRAFTIKHRELGTRWVLQLETGSLVIMAGDTQKVAIHGIPKRARCSDGRISLTFRRAVARPGPD